MFLKRTENGWSCVRCASPHTTLPLHPCAVRDQFMWPGQFSYWCRYGPFWCGASSSPNGFPQMKRSCASFLHFITFSNSKSVVISVAVRFKAWVCGHSIAGVAGSDPAEGTNIRLSCLLCVCVCDPGTLTIRRSRPELGCCATDKKLILTYKRYCGPG